MMPKKIMGDRYIFQIEETKGDENITVYRAYIVSKEGRGRPSGWQDTELAAIADLCEILEGRDEAR